MVFSYPTLCQSNFEENLDQIAEYQKAIDGLSEELGFSVINAPEKYVYPDELYFDTIYHLHAEGRKLRTEGMKNDLLGFLGK